MKDAEPGGLTPDIDALRQRGAATFDPVGFFYLEALARRAKSQQGPVKRLLDDKLAQALVRLRDNFERAQTQIREALDRVAVQHPQALAELQQRYELGDFAAVTSGIARLRNKVHSTPLGALAGQLSPPQSPGGADRLGEIGCVGLGPELQAAPYFRATWAKLSANKRVTQALVQAPKNAGPINSHSLVLRSLALMRDISPDYLNRLTSYVDTLLGLDQGGRPKQATAKKTIEATSGTKKTSRPARRGQA